MCQQELCCFLFSIIESVLPAKLLQRNYTNICKRGSKTCSSCPLFLHLSVSSFASDPHSSKDPDPLEVSLTSLVSFSCCPVHSSKSTQHEALLRSRIIKDLQQLRTSKDKQAQMCLALLACPKLLQLL